MREIKFRAWDKEEKKMIYEALEIKNIGLGEGSVLISEETQKGHELIWLQFTGLKDKNGKEIYAGDIVRDNILGSGCLEKERDNVGFIHQGEGGTWLWLRPHNEIDQIGGGETLLSVLEFEAEVIGNIYENPELLK